MASRRERTDDAAAAPALPPWKQEVLDDQGRRRLHGAFKGGYSAGYYNTVGSAEGWQPSVFVSSLKTRSDAVAAGTIALPSLPPQQTATAFMDEEDREDLMDSWAMGASAMQRKRGGGGIGTGVIDADSVDEDQVDEYDEEKDMSGEIGKGKSTGKKSKGKKQGTTVANQLPDIGRAGSSKHARLALVSSSSRGDQDHQDSRFSRVRSFVPDSIQAKYNIHELAKLDFVQDYEDAAADPLTAPTVVDISQEVLRQQCAAASSSVMRLPLSKEVAALCLGRLPPFAESEKCKRFTAYLEYYSGARKTIEPISDATGAAEDKEFYAAAISVHVQEKSRSFMSRFTSSHIQEGHEERGAKSQPEDTRTDCQRAAANGLYGIATRVICNFYPTRMMCKRFDCTKPHEQYGRVGGSGSGAEGVGEAREILDEATMRDLVTGAAIRRAQREAATAIAAAKVADIEESRSKIAEAISRESDTTAGVKAPCVVADSPSAESIGRFARKPEPQKLRHGQGLRYNLMSFDCD